MKRKKTQRDYLINHDDQGRKTLLIVLNRGNRGRSVLYSFFVFGLLDHDDQGGGKQMIKEADDKELRRTLEGFSSVAVCLRTAGTRTATQHNEDRDRKGWCGVQRQCD